MSPTIDWAKLQILFGHPEKLTFWLTEIVNHHENNLALITQAKADYAMKTQVSAIFSGIASLVGCTSLEQTCQELAYCKKPDYASDLEQLESDYGQLFKQIQHYLNTL